MTQLILNTPISPPFNKVDNFFFFVVVQTLRLTDNVRDYVRFVTAENKIKFDIVGTVYHHVIYMQSNKIHKVILMSEFIQRLCQLDMFRTSSVHHQERLVQAVFADLGMW